MKNILQTPDTRVDVVIDTDTYNEVDDQFALAYLFGSQDRCNVKAIYAAPFLNERASSPKDGMLKSYGEIKRLLALMGNVDFIPNVFKGSEVFLPDEKTPVISEAALDLSRRAMNYTSENPLYVIGIAALTDIASAILLNPDVAGRIVLIWLGGKMHHFDDASEFNLNKDVASARVAFRRCANRLVQVPCMGCVSQFATTRYELEYWLKGKNALCDDLVDSVIAFHKENSDQPWSKPIWDVVAVAWLMNDGQRFMMDRIERIPEITYDRHYEKAVGNGVMKYVYYVDRDALFADLFRKISDLKGLRYRKET